MKNCLVIIVSLVLSLILLSSAFATEVETRWIPKILTLTTNYPAEVYIDNEPTGQTLTSSLDFDVAGTYKLVNTNPAITYSPSEFSWSGTYSHNQYLGGTWTPPAATNPYPQIGKNVMLDGPSQVLTLSWDSVPGVSGYKLYWNHSEVPEMIPATSEDRVEWNTPSIGEGSYNWKVVPYVTDPPEPADKSGLKSSTGISTFDAKGDATDAVDWYFGAYDGTEYLFFPANTPTTIPDYGMIAETTIDVQQIRIEDSHVQWLSDGADAGILDLSYIPPSGILLMSLQATGTGNITIDFYGTTELVYWVIYYAGAWHRATPFCDFSLDDVTPGRVVFNDVEFGTEGEAMVLAGRANWMPFDFPQDSDTPPVTYNDISINPSEDLSLDFSITETDPIITTMPNYANLGEKKVVGLSGTGNSVDIDVTAPAGSWYGNIYYGGAWHQSIPAFIGELDPRTFSFMGVDFSAKDGEVIIVLGEEDPSTLPVELSSFNAVLTTQNDVKLNWISQTESNLVGYYVNRSTDPELSSSIMISAQIPATNTSCQHSYTFVDSGLCESGQYYYWLQSMEMDGSINYHGPISLLVNLDGDHPEIPETLYETSLKSVFPNPFNPQTTISYQIRTPGAVDFSIYNSRGQIVRTMNMSHSTPGSYSVVFDGKDANGSLVASGIYYVAMNTDSYHKMQKMLLMK